MNLGVVGGGSGGHITPISSFLTYISVYRKDEQQIKSIVWFGEAASLESQAAHRSGVIFQPILSGKMRRYRNLRSTFQNIGDFFKQIIGFFQSCYYLKYHAIDVLFCKGGYVALGVSCAAYVLRIPIIVHESDTYGGLTNRIISKIAKKKLSGFHQLGAEAIGQLLSPDLLDYKQSSLSQELATRYDPDKTIFLVMGGSQGSQVINEAILRLLDDRGQEKNVANMQFLIVGGSKNAGYKEKFDSYKNCKFFGFLSLIDIAYLYSIADVAITRSSATSVAEQKLFGLKCVYIPLPFTGGNHQYHNALAFLQQYHGDILLSQKDMIIPGFQDVIVSLIAYKKQEQIIDVQQLLYPHVRLYDTVLDVFEQQKKR